MNKITLFADNQDDMGRVQLFRFGTSHDRLCNSVIHSGTPKSRCYSNSRSYIDFLFQQHLRGNLTTHPISQVALTGPIPVSAPHSLEVLPHTTC